MRRLVGFIVLFLLGSTRLPAQDLEIVHLNVGQGDATLILGPEQPDGTRVTVLIDAGDIRSGGGTDGGAVVDTVLSERGADEIDFFIATHYDADHVGGAITGTQLFIHGTSFILGKNRVPGDEGDDDGDGDTDWLDATLTKPDPDELGRGDDILPGTFVDRGDEDAPDTQTYDKYVAMAEASGSRVSLIDQASMEAFEIDLGGGATLEAVAANGFVHDRPTVVENVNTENERSLAFLLSFGDFHYLTGGDMIGRDSGAEDAEVEAAVGEFITARGVSIDVLHVGHHGANNASDETFLSQIRPEVAIISAGNRNTHEHPDHRTLNRLEEAGVRAIFQTEWGTTENELPLDVRDIQAIYQWDVVLTTDGQTYEISTARRFSTDGG